MAYQSIFTILAYFSVALITVAIPIFALGVSYLGKANEKTIKSIRREERELEAKIKEMEGELRGEKSDKARISKLQQLIEEKEDEMKHLHKQYSPLMLKNAVFMPCILFISALITSFIGIILKAAYMVTWGDETLLVLNGLLLVGGGLFVIRTLKTIEKYALDISLPELNVHFISKSEEGLEKTNRIRLKEGKEYSIPLMIENSGDADVKEAIVCLYFPKCFEVNESEYYKIIHQPKGLVEAGNTTSVIINEKSMIYRHTKVGHNILLKTPLEKGQYEITYDIMEEQYGRFSGVLLIDVE